MSSDTFQLLNSVNLCQVAEMSKAAETFNPAVQEDCVAFSAHVRNVQAAVIHTYQLTAAASLREPDPQKAAALWEGMCKFCEAALTVLRKLKDSQPYCGTFDLYNLTLDYYGAAQKRYVQNQ